MEGPIITPPPVARWGGHYGYSPIPARSRQRLVDNPLDRPQRMILWNPRLAAHVAE